MSDDATAAGPNSPHHAPEPGILRRLVTGMRATTARAGSLLMPPVCLACRAPLTDHDALCPACWRGIDFIRPPLCDVTGLPLPYGTGNGLVSAAALTDPPPYGRARAVAEYTGVMRDLVHDLKFRDSHVSRRLLTRWLAEAGADLFAGASLVVPVPLSRWRLFQRRFNQAALLGQDLARQVGLGFAPDVLVRVKRTRPQVGLTRHQRLENVRGAFAVAPKARPQLLGAGIVLIDDVITTGATVAAAAAALKAAGAARVDVLALALVAERGRLPG